MPINRWLDKEVMIHIYNGILLSYKEKWNPAICDGMDGPIGYYAERSKSDREREIPYDFTYMQNLWEKKNKLIKNRLTKVEDNLVTAGVGVGVGHEEKGVKC